MPANIALYKDQLPKNSRLNFIEIYKLIASTISILTIICGFFFSLSGNNAELVYAIFLCVLVLLLLTYIYIRERSKLSRYAETVYFVHFVNHLIRDTFAYIQNKKEQDINNRISEILFAIANCFSILTGKTCSCVIEEMRPSDDGKNFEVISVNHDLLADTVVDRMAKHSNIKHYIEDNTDFRNLWYSINGCSRYYLCNNLIKAWRYRKYKHSYFKIDKIGEPKSFTILGFTFVTKWPLNYRSCLIVPIRFVGDGKPPETGPSSHDSLDKNGWEFYGFLCIYCNSRNVFNPRYCPELGGAFADLLYVFLNQLKQAR